jgi:hypothetical protein
MEASVEDNRNKIDPVEYSLAIPITREARIINTGNMWIM